MTGEEFVSFEIEFWEGDPLDFKIPREALPGWQYAFSKGLERGSGTIQLSFDDCGVVVNIPCDNIKDFYPDK